MSILSMLAKDGRAYFARAIIIYTSKMFINMNVSDNRTAHFKNVNNCLNTNIYFYLETSGGQSTNLYLNVVHFFNTSIN